MSNENIRIKEDNRLGKILRLLRTIQDMSVKELASKMEIAPTYICDVESNRKHPSLNMLEKYSVALGVNTSTILYFAEQDKKMNFSHQELLLSILQILTQNANTQ